MAAAATSSEVVVRGTALLAELQPEFPDVVALDAKAAQCVATGDVFAGLVCWERALFLRQHYLGFESAEVWAQARAMCEFCTTAAADALRRNDMDHARRLLSKANALSTQDDVLAIDILNQLACYYRRAAKLRVAYDYLKKAMAIDRRLHPPCPAKAAETRLNACAILSQLGRHDKALELAQAALILLQTQAMGAPAVEKTNAIDVFAAQAVAHHNIAVEEEFLQKPAQSLHSGRAGDESRGDGGATADSKAATEAKTSTEFEDETRDVNELRLDDDEHGEADHRIADEKEGPNPLEHEHTNDAPTYTGDEDDDVGEAKAEAKERMMDALDKESMKATEKPGDGHVVNVNAHEDDVGLEGDDTSYDDGGDQLFDLSDDDEGKHDDVADTKLTSA
ncbi:hypothetical protein AaE_004493 [Aphanomyces astaci]|uniref:Uncharacterized protein n=1 Tax=Aphanomyces astaci TaxID=112090 RepID=A0A6A5AIC0_APHAT|nr:hypothetical protein AaE_004493 [Aphanomyces astaci]